ncbi:MAG: GNAT family N-acetyltransferase [Vulcanimicrobiaceae bacterium]
MQLEVFDIKEGRLLEQALALRLRVFVDEQGFPLETEVDEHDRTDTATVHVLLIEDGRPIATGRAVPGGDGTARIGRMAVAADRRGRGYGATVLIALLAEIAHRGHRRAILHAQLHAVAFYERFGFRSAGEPLDEDGAPHQLMTRALVESEVAVE